MVSTNSLPLKGARSSRAALPPTPVWSLAGLRPDREAALPCLLDVGPALLVTSGRVAIGMALRAMDIGADDVVLMPAWHSPSMVPPVLWRGAQVRYVRLAAGTALDLDDAAAKLDGTVKAMIITHYFGFHQDLTAIRAFCDRHGLALLEDCAHAFFGRHGGRPIGSVGDYAIGSSMKFYPIHEGGCLVSAHHRLEGVTLHSAGPGFEAKAMLAALEHSFAYGRLKALDLAMALPLAAKSMLWSAVKGRRQARGVAAAGLAPASSDSSFAFDAAWVDKRSAWFSRWSLRRLAASRITTRRRRHYRELQAALTGVPGWRPLFATLPDDVCPWMFPIVADQPEQLAAQLLAAGLPMTRFGLEPAACLDATGCPTSAELARCVIAFPCHQDLNAAERAWMSESIVKALRAQ